MSDDEFLRGLVADWHDVASTDRSSVAEAHRRGRRRTMRGLIRAAAGLIVMGVCFGWFAAAAQREHSILMLIAALAYAASTALMATVLWTQARASNADYEQTPAGVLEQIRASAHSLRRQLASVRWAAIILWMASGAVGASFMFGAVSAKTAILLSAAWAVTAIGLWLWQSHSGQVLTVEVETCDRLLAELRLADE